MHWYRKAGFILSRILPNLPVSNDWQSDCYFLLLVLAECHRSTVWLDSSNGTMLARCATVREALGSSPDRALCFLPSWVICLCPSSRQLTTNVRSESPECPSWKCGTFIASSWMVDASSGSSVRASMAALVLTKVKEWQIVFRTSAWGKIVLVYPGSGTLDKQVS